MRRFKAGSAGIAVAALALTLAACGSDSGDSDSSNTDNEGDSSSSADLSAELTWWDTSDPDNEAPAYDELIKKFNEEYPDVTIEHETKMGGLETPYDGPVADAINASILEEDPDALVAPYLMSGGTDAKHWERLGIRSFGFAPLRLPADLDFTGLFDGVDERVPVDSLEFGARVLDRFLSQA